MNNQKIISICIPTWNRAKCLDRSLQSIQQQMNERLYEEVELLVSDNCSPDNTEEIVRKYQSQGVKIRYVKNKENIGGNNNFLQCMHLAIGKYILLLSDDDILAQASIPFIVETLKKKDWGVMHLSHHVAEGEVVEFKDYEQFIKRTSYMFTLISVNIFRKDAVDKVNFDKYKGSYLNQVPVFITSAMSCQDNVVINRPLFQYGVAENAGGTYPYFEVFVRDYLNIWQDFLQQGKIKTSTYKYLKRDIYGYLIKHHILWLLFNREKINKKGHRGFNIDNAWKTIFHYYGKESYFYTSFGWIAYHSIRYRVGKITRKISDKFINSK